MKIRHSLTLALCWFFGCASGCSTSDIPFLWKTYEHPTYRFQFKVPRTWEIRRDGLLGSAVAILASEEDPLFRANLNVVVDERTEKRPLKVLADLSTAQLSFLLNEYRLLSRAPTRLGSLEAVELRGQYLGGEGLRLIRTLIAVTEDAQYTVTFACRPEREEVFQKTFNAIQKSFRAKPNLSR